MNLKIAGTLLVLLCQSILAQTASTYFPSQTGYKWNFESVSLDSINNPVNSQKFFSIDSFTVVAAYNGKNANVVLNKIGPESTINFQPYLDTLYYNFESSNGFEYFDPQLISELLGNIDSSLGINFLNIFNSLEGWYSYYRMASGTNVEYQVFSKDTTVIINANSVPLRFQLLGRRLTDETINTAIGNFICKKFLLERRLSYLLFNIIPVKILGVEETIWLAPDNWKVKSYAPSTNVDLSFLNIPAFSLPGLETNIILPITNVEDEFITANNFELYQNYPNPFNPSTTIKYSIPNVSLSRVEGSRVQLKVYDILGNEVATLVDEYKPAGNYEVKYNSTHLASGIYYYQLTAGNYISTKKMIYLK